MAAVFEGTASGLITNFATDLICLIRKKWSINSKKKKLEEVLILIHSVLDATNGRVIRNPSLRRWLKNLKNAAEIGDRALQIVKRLLIREKKAKIGSSVFSPLFSAAAFARKLLVSSGDGEELDSALEKLEGACRNLKVFLRLLDLDGSSKKAGIPVRHLRVRSIDKKRGKISASVCRNSVQVDKCLYSHWYLHRGCFDLNLYNCWKELECERNGKIDWGRLYEFFDRKEREFGGLGKKRRNRKAFSELKSWFNLLTHGSDYFETIPNLGAERWWALQQICMANPLLYSISRHSVLFNIPPKELNLQIERSGALDFWSFERKRLENVEVSRYSCWLSVLKILRDCDRKRKMNILEKNISDVSAFNDVSAFKGGRKRKMKVLEENISEISAFNGGRKKKVKALEENISDFSAFKGCPSRFKGGSSEDSSLLTVNSMVENGESSESGPENNLVENQILKRCVNPVYTCTCNDSFK